MTYVATLNIADVIINIKSEDRPLPNKNDRLYCNFIVDKIAKRPDIKVNLEIIDKPLGVQSAPLYSWEDFETKFVKDSFLGGRVTERIGKSRKNIIMEKAFVGPYQAVLDTDLRSGTAHIISENGGWTFPHLFKGFLYNLLTYYLATKKLGYVLHASSLSLPEKRGYVFPGHSGSGKTTLASLFKRHMKCKILGDDRVIIRKKKDGHHVYPIPWSTWGSEHLYGDLNPARVEAILYIRHSQKNEITSIEAFDSFTQLYSNVLMSMLTKQTVSNHSDMVYDTSRDVKSYGMGFRKDKSAVKFFESWLSSNVSHP